jgi:hypothetical protein
VTATCGARYTLGDGMTSNTERVWVTGEEFPYSTSQVKKAGDRIRRAAGGGQPISAEDRRLLELYRSSHYPCLRHVQDRLVRLFHKKASIDPQHIPITARPLKTPEAITAKLIREKTRLNRIQDIAGARIVTPNRKIQDAVVRAMITQLVGLNATVVKDSRDTGNEDGYRAIHIVARTTTPGVGERFAEIQVRTVGEDAWANLVEVLDAVLGSDLKHGVGPADFKDWLMALSAAVAATGRGETVSVEELPEMPPLP